MARDIASVADKDTREAYGPGSEGLPFSELPRSEGGPATREPDESLDARPNAADVTPHEQSDSTLPLERDGDDRAAADRPAEPTVSETAPPVADASADSRAPAPSSDCSGTPDAAGEAALPDGNPAPEGAHAEVWRSVIADAIAEPSVQPLDEGQTASNAPASPVAHAFAPHDDARTTHPTDPADSPDASTNTALLTATEDLFRPAEIEEDPHLITLGRRLDPTRTSRPLLSTAQAPILEPAADVQRWWKRTGWKAHLSTAARVILYAVLGYFALVLLLIGLFRFANPPGSMLMLTQFFSGTEIDRRWVPLSAMSPHLVRAVIVSEDGRFCEHSGVDTAAIREAIERAAKGTPRGASTISMQVTKNLFLWNAKSYVRKVIEIPLTLALELVWPKWRVLEVYLNIAEWGPGVFGAEAAAQHHFNKPATRLTERESALLAAVLPNPVVRNAGKPGPGTSAKARVVQARVKAYGTVASCVISAAAAAPPAATVPAVRPAQRRSGTAKTPAKTAPARKKQPPAASEEPWAPTLYFGPR